jgi:hypothetical protein
MVNQNIAVDDNEQVEIVNICNLFKNSVQSAALAKKEIMRRGYFYYKSKLCDGDLLPTPSTEDDDKDADNSRPQIFLPMARQQAKLIEAAIIMSLMPNDEDYFTIKAKSNKVVPEEYQRHQEYEAALEAYQNALKHGVQTMPDGSPLAPPIPPPPLKYTDFEVPLQNGLKYVFKTQQIRAKLATSLRYAVAMGLSAPYPCIDYDVDYVWELNKDTGAYIQNTKKKDFKIDLVNFDPMGFYPEPYAKDPEKSKWVYMGRKKLIEVLDSDLYFNKEKAKSLAYENSSQYNLNLSINVNAATDIQPTTYDFEKSFDYDFYYFPYLKTSKKEYRNIVVGVLQSVALIRFMPNLTPEGRNPCPYFTYAEDIETPYGIGPMEEVMDIQKTINLMINYSVDVLSRIGNRFIATPDTDFTNLFGITGGVVTAENVENVKAIIGDYVEIDKIQNMIGVLKSEAQQVAGGNVTFQGSNNIDVRKTATEINVDEQNSRSLDRNTIEHIGTTGIQRVLDLLMRLVGAYYPDNYRIRVDVPGGKPEFKEVPFGLLSSGEYVIELTGTNPSQSKQAQVQGLMQLGQIIMANMGNPVALRAIEPIIKKVGILEGFNGIQDLLDEVTKAIEGVMQHGPVPAANPANPQGGMGANPNRGMALPQQAAPVQG